MRLEVKNFYHFLVRKFPIFFALIYALLFILFVKKVSKKNSFSKKILILNKERFWDDLIE